MLRLPQIVGGPKSVPLRFSGTMIRKGGDSQCQRRAVIEDDGILQRHAEIWILGGNSAYGRSRMRKRRVRLSSRASIRLHCCVEGSNLNRNVNKCAHHCSGGRIVER